MTALASGIIPADRLALGPLTDGYTDYAPKLEFSPSAFELASRCWKAWVLRYLYGRKARRSTKGQLFGHLIHECQESFAGGGTVYREQWSAKQQKENRAFVDLAPNREKAEEQLRDMIADAPRRALVCSHLMPDFRQCRVIRTELPINLFPRGVDAQHKPNGQGWRVSPMSSRDLVVQNIGGLWYLYDYKSTRGTDVDANGKACAVSKLPRDRFDPWYYAKTAEQLRNDVQALVYAYATMLEHGLTELWCRWIYTCTQGTPQAMAVDFHLTLAECEERLDKWWNLGDRMALAVNLWNAGVRPAEHELDYPLDTTTPDSPCRAFGKGCDYHVNNGGPCEPPVDYFQLDALEQQKEQAAMALTPGNPNQAPQFPAQFGNPNQPPFGNMQQPPAQPPQQPTLDQRMTGQASSAGFRPPEAAVYAQPGGFPAPFANAPPPAGFATANGQPLANPFGAPVQPPGVAPPIPQPQEQPALVQQPAPQAGPTGPQGAFAISPAQPPGNPFSQMTFILENDQLVPNNPVRPGRPARNSDGTFISNGQTALMYDGYGNPAVPPVSSMAQNISYKESCAISEFYGTAMPPADPALFPELAQQGQAAAQEPEYTPPPPQVAAPPASATPSAVNGVANPGGMPRKKAGEDDTTYQSRVAAWKAAKELYDNARKGGPAAQTGNVTVLPIGAQQTPAGGNGGVGTSASIPMTPRVVAALTAFSEASKALAEAIAQPNG